MLGGGEYNSFVKNKYFIMVNNRSQTQNRNTLTNAGISGALVETTSRYGSAGAEFLKGLRGVDYETGQVFDRSLIKVSQGK